MTPPDNAGSPWLIFAMITISCWGCYGIFLHKGQVLMSDPVTGRYKAFLFVGIAYFLTAVLGPLAMLVWHKAVFTFPASGMAWSLIAGTVGAIGAFCVLLAFGAKGSPAVVMSLIFAGAPIVNACIAITLDGGWGRVRWPFLAGILLAAAGAFMVLRFRPPPVQHSPAPLPPAAPIPG